MTADPVCRKCSVRELCKSLPIDMSCEDVKRYKESEAKEDADGN